MDVQHGTSDNTINRMTTVPPNDYLWRSSLGRAFPGSHHQFILHLLAVQYAEHDLSLIDVNRIQRQVQKTWPELMISTDELRSVAQEFVALEENLKLAYRNQSFAFPILRRNVAGAPPANVALNLDSVVSEQVEVELPRSFVDGYNQGAMTFTPILSSPFTLRPRPNTMPEESTDVSPARLSPNFSSRVLYHDDCGSTDVSVIETATIPSSNCNTPLTSPLPHNFEASKYPGMTKDSLMDTTSAVSAPNTSTIMVSIDDNVNITPENARMYAPLYLAALTQSRYGKTSINFALEPEEMQEEVVDNTIPKSSMPSELSLVTQDNSSIGTRIEKQVTLPATRRPDASRYVFSDSRMMVPASEADSYMAWYNPAIDKIPEKMEGYFWYCERCYIPPAERTGANKRLGGDRVKGKYSSKTSMDKHVSTIHKEKWKPAMPEKDREPGMSFIHQIIVAEDADEVLQAHNDYRTSNQAQRDLMKRDRRSLDGLRALDSPALMSLGENYRYKPIEVKRKLFQDELASRDSHVNRKPSTEEGALHFDNIEGKENVPRRSGHGGKEAAWEPAELGLNPSSRKVGFAKGTEVRFYDTGANPASVRDMRTQTSIRFGSRQRAISSRLSITAVDGSKRL